MDDPNITMEEYIRLEKEEARRRDKVYNWETARYGKIWYIDDIHDLRSVEIEFPSIVFNNELTSEKAFSCEPMVTIVYNDALTSKSDSSTEPIEIHHRIDEFDLKTETSLSEYDEEEQTVVYQYGESWGMDTVYRLSVQL
nr:hypothetical protein [Tanacetum cinerariifolium]